MVLRIGHRWFVNCSQWWMMISVKKGANFWLDDVVVMDGVVWFSFNFLKEFLDFLYQIVSFFFCLHQ
jgi:hypothetical protein